MNWPQHSLSGLLGSIPIRRKVFVSYHHDNDQSYYDAFSATFDDTYEVIHDNSWMRLYDSDDPDYIMRRIREDHIAGSSCTFVLCGAETWQRKYVDWEIKATLDKEHGLIGVMLPTCLIRNRNAVVPHRLHANIEARYANWTSWEAITTSGIIYLKQLIEDANSRSSYLIDNSLPLKTRNGKF